MDEAESYFHVVVERADTPEEVIELDLSKDDLMANVVTPYVRKLEFYVDGVPLSREIIRKLRVYNTPVPSSHNLDRIHEEVMNETVAVPLSKEYRLAMCGRDVTNQCVNAEVSQQGEVTRTRPADNRVFVIHGRDEQVRDAMFAFLSSAGLHPLEWEELVRESGSASPSVLDVVKAGSETADAFIVLVTPDDIGCVHERFRYHNDPADEKELTPQPRLNVVFEAGIAMAMARDKTVVVEFGVTRRYSDLSIHSIRMNSKNDVRMREAVLDRLETAGLSVNKTGGGWQTAGDFKLERFDNPANIPRIQASTDAATTKQPNVTVTLLEALLEENKTVGLIDDQSVERYHEILKDATLHENTLQKLRIPESAYEWRPSRIPIFRPVIGGLVGHKDGPPKRQRLKGKFFRSKLLEAIETIKQGEMVSG